VIPAIVTAIPVDIGRDEARDRAVRELSTPAYAPESSSWFRRALEWLWQRFLDLADLAGGGTAGRIVLAAVVTLLAVAVVVIVRRARPDAGRHHDDAAIFGDRRLTAAQYRSAADAAAAAGDWSGAVVERFRAVAADLEERGVVESRAGRTADELARAAGAAMPSLDADFRGATAIFDGVRYGGRSADPADHGTVQRLDAAVRRGGRGNRLELPR
jgi:hypothetical protein